MFLPLFSIGKRYFKFQGINNFLFRNYSTMKLHYFTDVEGNLDYFHRLVDTCDGVFYKDQEKTELDLKEDSMFIFGGDAPDKGNGSLRFLTQIVNLKKKYPERVIFILGNRDVNKMRYSSELEDKEIERLDSVLGPYWVKEEQRISPKLAIQKIYENEGITVDKITQDMYKEKNTKANRLRWMLADTMGSAGDFERRASELSILKKVPIEEITDEQVVESTLSYVSKGGPMFDFLTMGQLGYIHDETIFVHGAILKNHIGIVPLSDKKYETPTEWINALNEWCQQEIQDWIQRPTWDNEKRGKSSGFEDGDWSGRGGNRLIAYVAPSEEPSVIYNLMFGPKTNCQPLDPEVIQFLQKNKIQRLVTGHTPHGSSPTVIKNEIFEFICCDTSYSDFGKSPDNRGAAFSNVTIEGKNVHITGVLSDEREIEFDISLNENEGDPYIGREVPLKEGESEEQAGFWLKAILKKDLSYVAFRVTGYKTEFKYFSKEEVENLFLEK